MRISRNKVYISVAVAVLATAAAVLSIRSCTGDSADEATPTQLTPEQSAKKILGEPARFDPRSLEEMATEIKTDHEFNAEQISQMIVAVEAALNRLEQDIELLVVNEDASDSWNVLQEYAGQAWSGHLATVVEFLSRAPLTDEQAPRVATIHQTANRINMLIGQINDTQFKGRKVTFQIPY